MFKTPPRRWPTSAAWAHNSATCVAVLITALPASPGAAQLKPTTQISGYLTVGTDSRNRGLSQVLDDDIAAAIGIDIDFSSRAFAGAAISNVSYPTGTRWSELPDHLIKLYAGYDWQGPNWNIGTSLGHYRYSDTAVDYDYSELTFSVGYRNRFFYDVSVTDNYVWLSTTAINHEVGVSWPMAGDFELSAALGELQSRGPQPSYTHYNVGLSKLLGPVSVDLRRYDTSRAVFSPHGSSAADDWVLSLSYAVSLRD